MEGKPRLAPSYDLLTTAVYPQLTKKMAMKIGDKYILEEVMLRHWNQLAPDTQLARNILEKDLKKFAIDLPKKAQALLKALKKKGLSSPICENYRLSLKPDTSMF